jgi:hypothetical protein
MSDPPNVLALSGRLTVVREELLVDLPLKPLVRRQADSDMEAVQTPLISMRPSYRRPQPPLHTQWPFAQLPTGSV